MNGRGECGWASEAAEGAMSDRTHLDVARGLKVTPGPETGDAPNAEHPMELELGSRALTTFDEKRCESLFVVQTGGRIGQDRTLQGFEKTGQARNG